MFVKYSLILNSKNKKYSLILLFNNNLIKLKGRNNIWERRYWKLDLDRQIKRAEKAIPHGNSTHKRSPHASFIKKAHQLYPFSGGRSVLHVGIVRVGLEFNRKFQFAQNRRPLLGFIN